MKLGFKFTLTAAVVAVALSGTLSAQFDTDGPNAALTINGSSPDVADPAGHNVNVALPGNLVLEITSGANPQVGVILMTSLVDPTGAVVATPWGGSVDIGSSTPPPISNVTLVGDGVGLTVNPVTDPFFATDNGNAVLGTPPTFLLAYSAGTAFNGVHIAFQGIIQEPTVPPFFFDNTQAGDANFQVGQQFIALTGDDGSVNIPLVAGHVFNFHGVAYPDIWVNGNGFINFAAQTTLGGGGFNNDDVAAVNAEPAIFLGLCDWSPDGNNITDGVLYDEIGTTLTIRYGDPVTTSLGSIPHFFDTDANTFEAILETDDGMGGNPLEGQFTINTTILDPAAVTDFGNGLVGHTPGGAVIAGGAFDVNLRTAVQTGLANEAQVEEHDFDGTAATLLGYDGLGSPRGYNQYTLNWNGNSVQFLPTTAVVTGDSGYTSIPLGPTPPDDAQGISVGSLSSAGGETIEVTGSFFGFDPTGSGAGTVVFDPAGLQGGPFPASIVGILDDTASQPLSIPNAGAFPQHRDMQALQIITPVFTNTGMHDLQVNFASGATFTIQVSVTAPGMIVQSFTLADDGFMTVPTTVPVSYYGTMYNQVILNSNGFVTFVQGSGDFSETMAEFFDGVANGVDNPMAALYYSDLNPGGTGSGATYDVVEDTVNMTVQCQFNNQIHWSSNETAGSFNVTFDLLGTVAGAAGSVIFDHSGFLPATLATDDGITGVSDGDASLTAAGTDTDLTATGGLGGAQGAYVSPGNNDSVGELTLANSPVSWTSPLTFLESGSGLWVIL